VTAKNRRHSRRSDLPFDRTPIVRAILISHQEWDILTEEKKTADEVRDLSLLKEVQREVKTE
jgi:hypothetical protein